jgi:predicted TIM-barrel fold metal-dependent hydrolase
MARIDVHRHHLGDQLCHALGRRTSAPRLRRSGGGFSLEVAHEPATALDLLPHDPTAHAASLESEGVDTGLAALSGVEALPPDEARALIGAWHADAAVFPSGLGGWGALALREATPADVGAILAGGLAGVSVPAGAIAGPEQLDRLGPVLEALERGGGALFVHPGPAPDGAFLPALTDYVAGLSAAWLSWALHGRRAHPGLRVLFAALAGLAPLQLERLAARVGREPAERAARDPLTFLETSSYGPVAVHAVARVIGQESLVHGSDWPWATPRRHGSLVPGELLERSAARLLGPVTGTA